MTSTTTTGSREKTSLNKCPLPSKKMSNTMMKKDNKMMILLRSIMN